jgi:sugar phosphate isomerase/epimerase
MQLGLSTYAYPWACGLNGHINPPTLDAAGLLARAHGWGLGVVQLCDLPMHQWDVAALDETRALADELGLTLEVGTRGIAQDHLLRWIEIAQHMGARLLRTLLDTQNFHPTPAEAIALVRKLKPQLERSGVILMIENHDRFTAQVWKEIIEGVGSANVQLCFDMANGFGSLQRPEEVAAVLGPYIVNVHAKNIRVRRYGHSSGFLMEGTAAGQGMLDVAAVIKQVRAFGREPNVIVEHWITQEATQAETLAKEAQLVEESVAWLQTVV